MKKLQSPLFNLLQGLFTLLLVYGLSHSLIRLVPGNPVDVIIEEAGLLTPPEVLEAKLGLNQPLYTTLLLQLEREIHGDLGLSIISGDPVIDIIRPKFFTSIKLASLTLIFTAFLSLSLGSLAYRSHLGNRFCSFWGSITAALPTAWAGPIFLFLFAVVVPIFEISGSLLLGSITLSVVLSGFWARMIRKEVFESRERASVIGARARGISEVKIYFKYVLYPCIGPIIGLFFTQFGQLLGGSFIIELVFNIQGLGTATADSILTRDYPLVQSLIFLSALLALSGIALGKIIGGAFDPRDAKL